MDVPGGFDFWSRWLQVPLYPDPILAQAIAVFHTDRLTLSRRQARHA
jgi:hypothetical protein